ncbi:O-antigen ligase family protein [Peribacillus sp. YIM B13472]|uniref:O-antigen ligase family protein n=1 Tax=Peribacillus sp. YIM B13472 TaxID=3366297 RepID=UPI00366B4F90
MAGIQKQNFQQHKYLFYIIIIFLSIILGFLVSLSPVFTLIFFNVIIFLIWMLKKNNRIPIVLLISSSISINIIFSFNLLGFDTLTLYKLLVIFIVLIFLKYYGANIKNGLPVLALFLLLMLSYTLSDLHPRLNTLDPFISFVGLVSSFLILIVKWDEKMSNRIIITIPFLPLISVFVGAGLDILGVHPLITEEYSGGKRLQGANIGPHLAMLAFLGFCVSLIEIKRRANKKLLLFILSASNFLILLSTGTRGPLICCVVLIIVYLADNIKEIVKGRIFVIVPLSLFLITITTFLITQWQNIILRSFNSNTTDIGINLSGRDIAWRYFISQAKGAEIFGQGLGAVLVANDGSLYKGFTVPHNEYIRFFFDNGIIGLILIFGSLLFVLINTGIRLQKKIHIYYFSFILSFLIYSFVDNTLSTIQFIVPFCFYISALSSLNTKTSL